MSVECTTEDCANHTSTYLCSQCVSDLQQWLDKVPTLITELSVTVARLDQVRPANAGWNSGGVPGSAAPINLDALQLQENLRSVGNDANAYAQDERAAGLAWLIQDWVTKAELLVSGPEEETVNHAEIQERVKEANGEPVPPKEAIQYVKDKAKVAVKMADFKNWVKLGRLRYVLDRVSTDDNERRIYYPGDVFRVAQQMRERRVKI
jgi:hypothetical protein